ncbi:MULTISPECIES: YbaY family lipoprotein [Vibrio]|uniref:Lipo-like protein n=1 Tax=Vibrio bivalvicida TaxID=1276888 RepID=A0A177XZ03_9VIBR|nr:MULTISPECIES: YbaY family lipoprotein [Vibrio]KLN66369.1 lipo-like protein [Vibrio sp. VPAP30]OAJ93828.1 lipo-like protein [Vibrio bivalvicida]
MKKVLVLFASLVVGSVLVGCQSSPSTLTENKVDTVTGTVAYRERIALPKGALITVTLQDVSLADAPAKIIAKHRFETNGAQSPFKFDLAYHTSKIDPRHRYSVSARIEVNGKLRFITDTMYPVITDSEYTNNVDLRLVGVRH